MVVTHLCPLLKTHRTIYSKRRNCAFCKLCSNKPDPHKKKKTHTSPRRAVVGVRTGVRVPPTCPPAQPGSRGLRGAGDVALGEGAKGPADLSCIH